MAPATVWKYCVLLTVITAAWLVNTGKARATDWLSGRCGWWLWLWLLGASLFKVLPPKREGNEWVP